MADMHLPNLRAGLDALRERGAQGADPVRFRLIEALLRRAEAHEGVARQMLDDKVAALMRALGEKIAQAGSTEVQETDALGQTSQGLSSHHGQLAGLVAHIAEQHPRAADASLSASGTASAKAPHRDSPVDAKTLQFFKRTWSRLSADQRLAQSRSSLPDNAGPLNSQHLVHRSLNVMRELSPEYFDLFISHLDTLLWLERFNEQAARDVGLSPRAKSGGKKPVGGKRA